MPDQLHRNPLVDNIYKQWVLGFIRLDIEIWGIGKIGTKREGGKRGRWVR
jgi:hypothetical protein